MNVFEEAEQELGMEEGEFEGTFPAWLVRLLKEQEAAFGKGSDEQTPQY